MECTAGANIWANIHILAAKSVEEEAWTEASNASKAEQDDVVKQREAGGL